MTPVEWEIACGREIGWRKAYAAVEEGARAYLSQLSETGYVTTTQLVEALYPIAAVRGEGTFVRDRIFKALLANVDGKPAILPECRMRGPVKRIRGGVKAAPWLWTRPKPRLVCCPNCQYEFDPNLSHQDRMSLQAADTSVDASLPHK